MPSSAAVVARVAEVSAPSSPLAPAAPAAVVLFVVGGAVVIVLGLRTSPPEPPRHVLNRCTEHIERTPHTEYIERTCTP